MIISILKIIGLVLLVILAILLLLLGIILFVPIRYRFSFELDEKVDGNVVAKWMPALLKVVIMVQQNQVHYTICLLGGVVMTNTDAPISWLGRKFFSEKLEQESGVIEDYDYDFDEEDEIEQYQTQRKKHLAKKEQADTSPIEQFEPREKETAVNHVSYDSKNDEKKKETIFEKISKKITEFRNKLERIWKKLKKINDKKDALLKVYHSKRFEIAKKDVIAYIKILLKILKPKKLEGYLRFGMDDPATTGQILGGLAMLLPIYYNFFTIEPDFTQSIIKGYMKGNGKIRLFSIVKLVIKVMLNKNFIKVTKRVQTILEA